jgi:hypothetical protein
MGATRRQNSRYRLLLVLLVSGVLTSYFLAAAPRSYAYPGEPTGADYYIDSASTTPAADAGFSYGILAQAYGVRLEVTLDFGGQSSDAANTVTAFGGGISLSEEQIESIAETFAYWFYEGDGGSTASAPLVLYISTNNSLKGRDFSGGAAWGNMVDSIDSTIVLDGLGSLILTVGANDIEPDYSNPSYIVGPSNGWIQGYQSATQQFGVAMSDVGSADGCPQFNQGGQSCDNGWNQYDEWYASWGFGAFYPSPQIYYAPGDAQEWTLIARYGYYDQNHSDIYFAGPADEYPRNTSTNTSAQAVSQFSADLATNPFGQNSFFFDAEWEAGYL